MSLLSELFDRILQKESVSNGDVSLALWGTLWGWEQELRRVVGHYDRCEGFTSIDVRRRKRLQFDFDGVVWLARERGTPINLDLPFDGRVTDKRCTKQGIELLIRIGDTLIETNEE